jgi:lipopolysaccharide assembly protein A
MRTAAFWSVILIAAALLVPFAIANRATVLLGLWPFPFVLEMPVYLLVLLSSFAGFVVGAVAIWIAGHGLRRELRRRRRRVEALERELAATQTRLTDQSREWGLQPTGHTEKRGAPA